jgi:hypothetical protein
MSRLAAVLSTLTLVFSAHTHPMFARSRSAQSTDQSPAWTQLRVGELKDGFRITRSRQLEYRGRPLTGAAVAGWVDSLSVSPVAGDRWALAVPRTDGDAGYGYLVDVASATVRELRFKSPLYTFASWSPTLSTLLLAGGYEQELDIHVVNLASYVIAPVVLPHMQETEALAIDTTDVRWESPRTVMIAAHSVCSRYFGDPAVRRKCDPSVVLRRLVLKVDVGALQAMALPAEHGAARITPPSTTESTRNSGSGNTSGSTDAVSVSGVWSGSGTDSSGPGEIAWDVTQEGLRVSGRFKGKEPSSGLVFEGPIIGQLSGSTLTFTMTVERGTLPRPYQSCEITLRGAAEVSAIEIRGTYEGQSCGRPVRNGQLTLLKN